MPYFFLPCSVDRSILTDERLCVLGSNGSIYAIGDAATIDQPKALDFADELFQQVREWVGEWVGGWFWSGCADWRVGRMDV
jgi:NADPH-dependent 2,4-dienoyl-CoA reductase/sulfur reductase-like enzyme